MTEAKKVVAGYYICDLEDADGSNGWDGRLHPTIEKARESLHDPVTRETIRSNERWAILECRVVELDSEPAADPAARDRAAVMLAQIDDGELRGITLPQTAA